LKSGLPVLPKISDAKLPATYETAKSALAECSRIDECADWANKAEALASYAKQAEDDTLRKMADRIQARAIRRCGELLRAIPRPEQGGRPAKNGVDAYPVSRAQAGREAGLSRHQQREAMRVARIPEADFEAAVESDDPPTVTELAERGKTPQPLLDLQGRDPQEFAASTEGQGHIRRLAEFAERVKPSIVVRGAFPKEQRALRQQAKTILEWLDELLAQSEAEAT
jgi:hypothetical protein